MQGRALWPGLSTKHKCMGPRSQEVMDTQRRVKMTPKEVRRLELLPMSIKKQKSNVYPWVW